MNHNFGSSPDRSVFVSVCTFKRSLTGSAPCYQITSLSSFCYNIFSNQILYPLYIYVCVCVSVLFLSPCSSVFLWWVWGWVPNTAAFSVVCGRTQNKPQSWHGENWASSPCSCQPLRKVLPETVRGIPKHLWVCLMATLWHPLHIQRSMGTFFYWGS